MNLRNKSILITAGPTWVALDKVRVISNIATGETGILLAEKLKSLGAKVTLVLGPVGICSLNKEIKLLRFKFFDELRNIIIRELRSHKYDIIIHSAAVSDFGHREPIKNKLDSSKICNIRLVPLPKIIRDIRRLALNAKLVMFKLETGVSEKTLIKRARESYRIYKADLVVANRLFPEYKAFILDRNNIYDEGISRKQLIKKLVNTLLGVTNSGVTKK
jgi:phosphopantothenoylcysteine decarboxylase/phosphopantothenate--cysteine ligase